MSQDGFDSFAVELTGFESGIPWIALDVKLVFELQTKTLAITPALMLGDVACLEVYADLCALGGGCDTGVDIYGLSLECSWDGVSFKALSVFDAARYAITTPEYGSVIESIADALALGHDYYPDVWELFSVEAVFDGCCGGGGSFLVNTYFDHASGELFDWAMTHVEAKVSLDAHFALTGLMEVNDTGLDHIGLGFAVSW